MKFSVVIVTFNRLNLLKECLFQVLNQTFPVFEVIVVNNASSDGTKEYLDLFVMKNTNVRVIHSESNLGGAGGFKKAIEAVNKKSEYILIIDDDAMIAYNFLEQIYLHMDNNILAYSGTVVNSNKIDFTHRRIISNNLFLFKKDVPSKMYEDKFFDYDLATFCGLVISKQLVRKIGLPRTDFFIWYDDTEYSLRIRKYSKIRNVNSAQLNHKTIAVTKNRLGWKSYYGYRNFWAVGLEYSSNKIIFNVYRNIFHFMKICIYRCKLLFTNNEKDYYKYIIDLNRDVIKDIKNGTMGKNSKYLP